MNLLFEEYKYKTELHAHTSPVSMCSQIPAEDMAGIYKKLGYDSITITNHFEPSYALSHDKNEFIEYYINDYHTVKREGEKLGINVLLGAEVRFTEHINDYLVFGICEDDLYEMYEYLDKGIEVFYKEFKNDKNVILQAHPFRDGMKRAPKESLDGIETFNMHPGHNSRVAVASAYAAENDMLVTCGTDYHHPGHEGLAAVRTKMPLTDSYELAAAIKSRDYMFEIGKSLVLPYALRK